MRERGLGSSLIGKARRGVAHLERGLGLALRCADTPDLPIVLGHESHALALALYHEGKRGGLHATGTAHVAKAPEAREREIAGEHRTPDEVDVLTALARIGKILIQAHQVIEGRRDLPLDEVGITGATRGNIGCHLAHAVEGIRTDELALAVEVCGDDYVIGLFCKVFEHTDNLLLRGLFDNGRPREIR